MILPRVSSGALPLDLGTSSYAYIERPNPAIVSLLSKHVLAFKTHARVLDVGCGCGANARAFHERSPAVSVVGVEPNPRAAELARLACDEVFHGTMEEWRAAATRPAPFDALVLSDVLEHIVDPIGFIRSLQALEPVRDALWIVSVPNYAVWYNRVATVLGLQEYRWSGLWDRTHLRFFTRRTAQQLLEYCGLSIIDEACTPSVVQSAAPTLRKWFEGELQRGEHLAMYGIARLQALSRLGRTVRIAGLPNLARASRLSTRLRRPTRKSGRTPKSCQTQRAPSRPAGNVKPDMARDVPRDGCLPGPPTANERITSPSAYRQKLPIR